MQPITEAHSGLLLDSVGKKLKAIDAMLDELQLDNVCTHHGRVEEIVDDPIKGRKEQTPLIYVLGGVSLTSLTLLLD
jgi:hypothetical protein